MSNENSSSMNVIPKISQLSGRVWRFLGCNPGPMTLQGTNIYLVGTGPRRILIDAGQDGFPEYVTGLKSFLSEHSISLERIVITHWHHDHVGALEDLQKAIFSKQSTPPVHKFRRKEPNERDLPDGYILKQLQDNEQFSTDGATLRVLFTPGHTSDHAALYLQEEKAVFSGDCILGEGTAVFEDLHDYINSLKKIMGENPELIYPGHGPIVEQPNEKIQFYIQHRQQREDQILNAIQSSGKPVTPAQIVQLVYTDTPKELFAAAEINVQHHLEKLIKEKKILRKENIYFPFDDGKI